MNIPQRGELGPDLTHVGARRTIAAATRANTRQNLRDWIENSQKIKPGNFMPPMDEADPGTLADLVDFLRSLK
jgi:cytochrome c oxidase subunit 2